MGTSKITELFNRLLKQGKRIEIKLIKEGRLKDAKKLHIRERFIREGLRKIDDREFIEKILLENPNASEDELTEILEEDVNKLWNRFR